MFETQHYALIVFEVELNNALMNIQSGNIGIAAQHLWGSKGSVQEI